MLYTRKGDDGTTELYGTHERLPKDSPIYEALGTLDELNSLLGVCRAGVLCEDTKDTKRFAIAAEIKKAQECIFIAQAELAGAMKSISQKHLDAIEATTDRIETIVQNPHGFVIPGATELSALLDLARAVCRRAERTVITAAESRPVSFASRAYLNRLSSLLYALARYAATSAEVCESGPAYV
jgi:cob(I)alamin adenosyltransferase